jgi:hypothetical protein
VRSAAEGKTRDDEKQNSKPGTIVRCGCENAKGSEGSESPSSSSDEARVDESPALLRPTRPVMASCAAKSLRIPSCATEA